MAFLLSRGRWSGARELRRSDRKRRCRTHVAEAPPSTTETAIVAPSRERRGDRPPRRPRHSPMAAESTAIVAEKGVRISSRSRSAGRARASGLCVISRRAEGADHGKSAANSPVFGSATQALESGGRTFAGSPARRPPNRRVAPLLGDGLAHQRVKPPAAVVASGAREPAGERNPPRSGGRGRRPRAYLGQRPRARDSSRPTAAATRTPAVAAATMLWPGNTLSPTRNSPGRRQTGPSRR